MTPAERPYDPQPAREDALADLAARGYAEVSGEHEASLSRLRARTRTRAPRARRLRRVWLAAAAAAAIALCVVIGLQLYRPQQAPLAADLPAARTPAPPKPPSPGQGSDTPTPSSAAPSVGTAERQPVREEEVAEAEPPVDVPAAGDPARATRSAPPPRDQPSAGTSHTVPVEDESAESFADQSSGDHLEAERPSPARATTPADATAPAGSADAPREVASRATANTAERRQVPDSYEPVEAADAPAQERIAEAFALRRSDEEVDFRELRVDVLDAGGQPIPEAEVYTEVGRRRGLPLDEGGFRLLAGPDALVGVATAPGFDTLRFDLTAGTAFTVRLSRDGRPLPPAPGDHLVDVVAPWAEPYPAFDAFALAEPRPGANLQLPANLGAPAPTQRAAENLAGTDGPGPTEPTDSLAQLSQAVDTASRFVVVQFSVDGRGRPRRIEGGPGPQDREALRRARRLLRSGPDWPAAYREGRWRYRVELPAAD